MSLPPPPGTVVVYWEGGAPAFALVTGEEKQRIALVTDAAREDRIAPSRIACEVERGVAPARSLEGRKEAAARVLAVRDEVTRIARDVDVATLWDLVSDRQGPESEDDLAEIALGRRDGRARAAMLLALTADGLRFMRRAAAWLPRDAEALDALLAERSQVARRAVEREDLLSRLGRAWRGEGWEAAELETERRTIAALETLAIDDMDAPEPERDLARDVLAAVGVRADRPHEGAFRLLRAIGRFSSDDENLAIARYDLRTEFSLEVMRAAEAAGGGFARAGRRDLTGFRVITIDAPLTREIDDALSAEPGPDGALEIGIHIADPCAFVAAGDPVDREARGRGTTFYFPDRKLLMIPASISEGAASLVEGAERPALSFLVRVDPSGRVLQHEIVPSIVRVARRLDYDAVDALLGGAPGDDEVLARLSRFAEAREAARARAGALLLHAAEVEAHVERDGTLWLSRRDPHSASQRIVAEAMVLSGEVAARWLDEHRIPAIYRRQAAPDVPLPAFDPDLPEAVHTRAVRRVLRRGEGSTSPGAHFGLGLSAYAQVTSPLRRYQDLALHRQILAVLAGGPPVHDLAAMQEILASTERAEIDARRAERMAERYWLLRWMERSLGSAVTGVVVDTVPRPIVVLDETLLEEPVPSLVGAALGDRVRLRVERVNPRADILALRPA